MRTVIQRVSRASVSIHGQISSAIGPGLLILVGIEAEDRLEDIQWLANKIVGLRIFNDAEGKMNLSVKDVDGELLAVSQFTLHASTRKGFRPSYIKAARPEFAIPLYERFLDQLTVALGKRTGAGVFGADMKVELINDGPVTICIDSKMRE